MQTDDDRVVVVCEFSESAVVLWAGCTRRAELYDLPAGSRRNGSSLALAASAHACTTALQTVPLRSVKVQNSAVGNLTTSYDEEPLWSVREAINFTQSAGLVAMPKHAHRRRHSDPALTWFIRGVAFIKFGYDPLGPALSSSAFFTVASGRNNVRGWLARVRKPNR